MCVHTQEGGSIPPLPTKISLDENQFIHIVMGVLYTKSILRRVEKQYLVWPITKNSRAIRGSAPSQFIYAVLV